MHKHYLLSPTLLLFAPSIPSPHLKRTSFWTTLEELPFFRVLSNLNKRRSGIWILLCLIKGKDPQLSSLACSLAVCQRPVFKKDASPQDWCTVIWYIPRSISPTLGFFEKSLLGHKLAQGNAGSARCWFCFSQLVSLFYGIIKHSNQWKRVALGYFTCGLSTWKHIHLYFSWKHTHTKKNTTV